MQCLQKKCSNCYKVSYCSIEHQKEDWVNHKIKCRQFPIQYKRVSDGGKNILTASKKILPGQLIFKETSLISGPFLRLFNSKVTPSKPTCLSCYKEMNPMTQYSCSNCEWAVCNSTCEKEKIHADFECKIFREKNVEPIGHKTEVTADGRDIYTMITVLRTLLLRDSAPDKWNQIMNLYSYPNLRRINPKRQNFQKLLIKFIRETCGLSGFDANTIARIGGIVLFNSRGNHVKHTYGNRSQEPKTTSFLFHDLSHLSMNEGEHCNCTIHQTQINKFETQVEVFAKGRIEAGEILNYTDVDLFALIRTKPVQFRSATSERSNSELEQAASMFQQFTDATRGELDFLDNEMTESSVRQLLDGPK